MGGGVIIAIVYLYHGENNSHFDEMIKMSVLYKTNRLKNVYRTKLVKQQSTVSKHVNQTSPLLHNAPGLERGTKYHSYIIWFHRIFVGIYLLPHSRQEH